MGPNGSKFMDIGGKGTLADGSARISREEFRGG